MSLFSTISSYLPYIPPTYRNLQFSEELCSLMSPGKMGVLRHISTTFDVGKAAYKISSSRNSTSITTCIAFLNFPRQNSFIPLCSHDTYSHLSYGIYQNAFYFCVTFSHTIVCKLDSDALRRH